MNDVRKSGEFPFGSEICEPRNGYTTRTRGGQSLPNDRTLLAIAAEVSRKLPGPDPWIYWPDFILSAAIGYASLSGTVLAHTIFWRLTCAVVSIFSLYRAASFIHELTHLRRGSLPGFRFTWNLLVGIPLLIPSFLYEGVHTQHHVKTRYGTVHDPEYLPLASMKPRISALLVVLSAVAPLGLFFRFAILAPLGLLLPPVRALVWERYSALSINPDYRRRANHGPLNLAWVIEESAACLFAWMLLLSPIVLGWRPLLTYCCILAGMSVINQLRTLTAHLWENEGEVINVTAQYLDSVNVPPPNRLAFLWAPVGLRYHALHHLLPSVPYHALGLAHRHLMDRLPPPRPMREPTTGR
ncbi:MAG: fatty acid desaturase [Acetobacter sp.]|nr:fatty acid desaturase [Acetobacter sp.]MCH4060113.1 fatty acid desaturase [Acetobacter sp.]MCH4087053.1 fatty acid desaturase [Acetobacter sp.]MCI1292873.1 fatty acid desaturase [Acetobacter sp.]MCI1319459.1 fatty acid desaturase [Acetobacter sp.]